MLADRLKVLLVDNNTSTIKVFKQMIHAAMPRTEIVGSTNVEEARRQVLYAAISGKAFDFIISDVDLLDSTGFDLAQKLTHEVANLPRFIFMSETIDENKISSALLFNAEVFDKFDLAKVLDALIGDLVIKTTGTVRIIHTIDDIIRHDCKLCGQSVVVRYDGTLAPHRREDNTTCEMSMQMEYV